MDMQRIRRPIHLILDWDGTLTRKDTLHLVGRIGYQAARRLQNENSTNESYQPHPRPEWSIYVDGYMTDYKKHISAYKPAANERRNISEERRWLASLAPVEHQSVHRVEQSGLFRGATTADIDSVAQAAIQSEEVQLRPGWTALLLRALGSREAGKPEEETVSILSVNWSRGLIRRNLWHALNTTSDCSPSEKHVLQDFILRMEIDANEISDLDAPDGSNGGLSKCLPNGIRTSADKLAHLPPHCRDSLDLETTKPNSTEPTVIYVGDSATDLESLLAADVGICMRDEPMGSSQQELADTLERIGVKALHVADLTKPRDGERVVYWAKDLIEIANVLPDSTV